MIYTNSHQLCVIDVETTGIDPSKHEIVEICFLPLGMDLEIQTEPVPFTCLIKPDRPDDIDWDAFNANAVDFQKLMNEGLDKWTAVDLFMSWVEGLRLPPNKRILPIAHNWPFDSGFVKEWLCPITYFELIDGRARDTLSICQYINDSFAMRHEQVPFPKTNLSYVASQLKIPHDNAHCALDDCVVTAKVLQKLIQKYQVM